MRTAMAAIVVLAATGCVTSKGFTPMTDIHKTLAYRVTNETPTSFDLETHYQEYSFVEPYWTILIDKARGHFDSAAAVLARDRGKEAGVPPLVTIAASTDRNMWGVNTIVLGARVTLRQPLVAATLPPE
jgi:hypothetical protein